MSPPVYTIDTNKISFDILAQVMLKIVGISIFRFVFYNIFSRFISRLKSRVFSDILIKLQSFFRHVQYVLQKRDGVDIGGSRGFLARICFSRNPTLEHDSG